MIVAIVGYTERAEFRRWLRTLDDATLAALTRRFRTAAREPAVYTRWHAEMIDLGEMLFNELLVRSETPARTRRKRGACSRRTR